MAPKFDFDALTLGEVATIEDLSGTAIGALGETTPQGKFLAALLMIVKRRSGEPTFTFNQALNVPIKDAQTFLGFDGDQDDDETGDEGKDETSDESVTG